MQAMIKKVGGRCAGHRGRCSEDEAGGSAQSCRRGVGATPPTCLFPRVQYFGASPSKLVAKAEAAVTKAAVGRSPQKLAPVEPAAGGRRGGGGAAAVCRLRGPPLHQKT